MANDYYFPAIAQNVGWPPVQAPFGPISDDAPAQMIEGEPPYRWDGRQWVPNTPAQLGGMGIDRIGILPQRTVVPTFHQPAPGRSAADYGPGPVAPPLVAAPSTLPIVQAPMARSVDPLQFSSGRALPPASGRYSAGIPLSDFIYTNPVAAQQAAASLQARLGFEQNQDEGYRRYLIAQEQAKQQQAYQTQRASEADKDRALQREGFASSERSAAARGNYNEYDRRESARQAELAQNKYTLDLENYRRAVSLARHLNDPRVLDIEKRKLINTDMVIRDAQGIWVPSLPEPTPPRTAATATPGTTGIPTIADIQARTTLPPVLTQPAPVAPPPPPPAPRSGWPGPPF